MRSRVAVALFLLGGPAYAEMPQILDCTQTFTRNVDEAALAKAFGRANVTSAMLDGAEGASERGTVIFAKDPARRIEIFWHDPKKKRRPASVMVRGSSTWAVRPAGGDTPVVGLKTRLADVEKANARPFKLYGFSWDMGGYATGWNGGTLDKIDGGCALSVRFEPDPKAKDKALDKVSGEKTFGSSDAAMLAVKPTVSQLSLGWPQ